MTKPPLNRANILAVVGLMVTIGAVVIAIIWAAAPTAAFEPENGTLAGTATITNQVGASNNSLVLFSGLVSTPTISPTPTVTPTAAPTPSPGLPSTLTNLGYRLAWSDEFLGAAVDTGKWNVQNNSNYGSSNHEDQCYLSGNAAVGGGLLSLTAKRQTVSGCGSNPDGGSKYYWTSAFLTTRAQGGSLTYGFTHGYAEIRMLAPRGNAYWPAFWLVSTGQAGSPGWPDYGEFDVVELYGARPDSAFGTLHYTASSGHIQTSPNQYNLASGQPNSSLGIQVPPLVAAAVNTWHTYGLWWTTNRLTWFVDGRAYQYFDGTNNTMYTVSASGAATPVRTFSPPAVNFWATAHSLIVNLAVGGSGPAYYGYTGKDSASGYRDGNLAADVPGAMLIDYVRVWRP